MSNSNVVSLLQLCCHALSAPYVNASPPNKGNIFAKIIDEVIEGCQNDFEEGGVDPGTLDEMKKAWQKRISEHKVAHMPWDPAPAPQTPIHYAVPVSSNAQVKSEPQQYAPSGHAGSSTFPKSQPRVKQEPYDTNINGLPPYMNGGYNPGLNPALAQQRAAMHLQQRYGEQANNSIASLQAAAEGIAGQPRTLNRPTPDRTLQQHGPPQYHPYQQPPSEPQPKREILANAQTDGAGDTPDDDWSAVVTQRNGVSDEARRGADGMIRRHFEDMAQRKEPGGSLTPLDERRSGTDRKRKITSQAGRSQGVSALAPGSPESAIRRQKPRFCDPQCDGAASDDEKVELKDEDRDEDAINSDLDDDEDELGKGEGEDGTYMGDTVMCTYDKVQRVKNKWKCTLKDGILSADGKEYIFHKASGEFEW